MKTVMASIVSAVVLCCAGCAHNGNHGDGGEVVGEFYFEKGIWGDGHNVLVKRGSKLKKISVIGNHNLVTIEEGVYVAKVEVVGNDNTFYYPHNCEPERSVIGNNKFDYLENAPAMHGPIIEVRGGESPLQPAPNAATPPESDLLRTP